MIKLPRFTRTLLILACSLLAAGALQAQYVEVGDSGTTLATAQGTGATSGQALTSISGIILNGMDGDFFYINITDPANFMATTVGGSALDTMIYLFTMNGSPVYLNDDAPNGLSIQSTLPAGASPVPLAIGTYIIGISLSGAEPLNAGNQALFADAVFSTDIRGPRLGANGPVTSVSNAFFSETGGYTINLIGAATAIPEPTTLALLAGAGVFGLVAWRRRASNS